MFCREFCRVGHRGASPAGLLADDTVDGDGGVGQPEEAHEDGCGVVRRCFVPGEIELRTRSSCRREGVSG